MKQKLLLLAFLASGGLFAAIGVGITIGPPPPPPVAVAPPPVPGPGYVWIQGYWYPVDGRYLWHRGYWTRPPYEGARWIGPRHDGRAFYEGYWDGEHGRIAHDHRWDRDHDRDLSPLGPKPLPKMRPAEAYGFLAALERRRNAYATWAARWRN